MSTVLKIENLCKKYPAFELDNVSFGLEKGRIMGFIGRNGAGKTTTLKALLNFVHPDSGEISFFGENFLGNEFEVKKRIGFVSGGIDFYPRTKLKTITAVTSAFYESWDEKSYRNYLELFALDENKTPNELSAGMRVKYSLALALSHNAELLILDEPTSGLDPVSRDELLEIFLSLTDKGISILFSTHITSDLDKCADDITYIKKGKIIDSTDIKSFLDKYRVVHFATEEDAQIAKVQVLGLKRIKEGYSALILREEAESCNLDIRSADLEDIMVHLDREDNKL